MSFVIPEQLLQAAEKVRAQAGSMQQAQIDFLSDLIRFKTLTGEEGPAVERTLVEMQALRYNNVRTDGIGDVLAEVGDGPHRLLYDAHLDENEIADPNDWPYPPLEPTVSGGKLYGLGASDCKGGVATILYGAHLATQLGITRDCTVIVQGSTLEEDAEGFAMRYLLEEEDFIHPDGVLLAEATDLTLRRGQRGRCEVKVRVPGKAAHASLPHLGDNAILKARPVLDALEAMTEHLPEDPIFGKDTQVVTMISSPHTPNSVPAWCEITVDRRLGPGQNGDDVLAEIRRALSGTDAMVELPTQPVRSWTGVDLSGPAFFPGWLLPEDDALMQAGKLTCAALWGQVPVVDVWKFSTNGTYSAGVAGIPTLGYGPQEEQYAHTPQDQIDLNKMLKATMFYALFPMAYSYIQKSEIS